MRPRPASYDRRADAPPSGWLPSGPRQRPPSYAGEPRVPPVGWSRNIASSAAQGRSPHVGGDEIDAHRVLDTVVDLGKPRHVCAFFTDIDEQYRVLRSFIKDGLDRGDRAFHLVDPERRGEHLRRLAEAGVDVPAAIEAGQLQVQVWEPGTHEGRRFDPDSWLGSFQRALEAGPEAGYARTRFLGHMGWAHRDAADDEDWFEFEARLNDVLAEHEDAVICAYDLRAVSAGVVIDALRTHSAVILGGLLQENPFFATPDEIVREIQERRARRPRMGR